MRRILNKLKKEKKEATKFLDPKIINSSEFQAIEVMNIVMNCFDNLNKIDNVKFDPMEGDELYIEARFASNNFLSSLIEKISKEADKNEKTTIEM